MSSSFPLKPAHKPVKDYFAALATFHRHGHTTEGNTRSAFSDLLRRCCPPYGWHLVEEYSFKGTGKQSLRADGALVDDLTLVHGLWEAKDSNDDLEKEIRAKRDKGYPLTNIIFQSPSHATLYQDNTIAFNDEITDPQKLVEVLQLFFEHRQAHEVDWEEAVNKFAEKIPDLARGVTTILQGEDKRNPAFRETFQSFAELCRQSINPDLTDDAIRKMLVQHLLTERIFRKVFNNQEFLQRNVIAAEIEKVIRSITARHFSRDEFLKPLDRFYTAIEKAAESQQGYTEKQHFLNAVYEKFFQRFDVKQSATHGIVYTPQPIVDFMVHSVDAILRQEFGKNLSDPEIHILDPFTGTGNFITRIMQQIKRSALQRKYTDELHCNEIMLLPYYIASMNIEHAYLEKAGSYCPFEGICLVDTFDLAEGRQHGLFSTENSTRVKKQQKSNIKVVIGNPPYRKSQKDENDQNKNRSYPALDAKVAETYTAGSAASLNASSRDPYIRAFRWATDRIEDEGIICYITNSGYLDDDSQDGMRKHLLQEFSRIYVIDLGGNVRKNPRLSGTTHNVFGIKPGVAISVLVKRRTENGVIRNAEISYTRMEEYWKKGAKLNQLDSWGSTQRVPWTRIVPDHRNRWINVPHDNDFSMLTSLSGEATSIFHRSSLGISTNRDDWATNFQVQALILAVNRAFENFRIEQKRYRVAADRKRFALNVDGQFFKWSETAIRKVKSRAYLPTSHLSDIRSSNYRPFCSQWMCLNDLIIDRPSLQRQLFPSSQDNLLISYNSSKGAFHCLASSKPSDLHFTGDSVCLPFYVFDELGSKRIENISDESLTLLHSHYHDESITKRNLFNAIYAVLHHPEYRIRYAGNLHTELPRIPFPPDFHAFSVAGKRLLELHVDYDQQPEYKLDQIEDPKAEVTFRVARMKLSKDKTELRYNEFLLLRGIPLAAFAYRLGNRSALEWVIDQYRVSTDARSGIVNDPNRDDDPEYILRLVGQVITVSLETQQIIAALPSLN